MNTNIILGIIVELGSFAIIFIGFIIAIVFFIMARSQGDVVKKKKLDKKAIWFFIGPILLVVLSRVVYGIYNNANSMNNSGTSTEISCNLVMPIDSSVVWHKYCDKNFGFYYPDGWKVEYSDLIHILVITSPTITNYPGYEGRTVEYVIPYGIQSVGGPMTLQSYGFTIVDSSGKVMGLVKSNTSVIQNRPESSLASMVMSSFKQF